MTEQNYLDPEQGAPAVLYQQALEVMLQRIAALEQQVAELQSQLLLAQGGAPADPA